MIEFLLRPHTVKGGGILTTQEDQRTVGAVGRDEAGECVRESGPPGDQRDGRSSAQSRGCIGRHRRYRLVATVDKSDPDVVEGLIDAECVISTQGEDTLDPMLLQHLGQSICTVNGCHLAPSHGQTFAENCRQ
ncbi:hypothetical protein GCM10009710_36960 [Aeromicrobium alkaliterrae]|uniref:Uncharacterized protein n=1 Tax=Aeromicrobium alkaliterrae TaxID=302168 RepID=A0ABP4WKG2_9ACTN